MGLCEIPKPVKTIFESFPLKKYPAIQNTTESNEESLKSKKFHFTSQNTGSSKNWFTLGIYNVIEYKEHAIATDPVSLNHQLVLCHKNRFKLPKFDQSSIHSQRSTPPNSISIISYHGSPNGELPIMIESNGSKRVVRTNNELKVQDDGDLSLVGDLLDYKMYDTWIMMLLIEGSENLLKIYTSNHACRGSVLDSLVYDGLLESIVEWNDFRNRYAHCFNERKLGKINYGRLTIEYNNNLKLLESMLSSLEGLEVSEKSAVNDFSLSDLKLASYVKAIQIWGPHTNLGRTVATFGLFADRVMDKFID